MPTPGAKPHSPIRVLAMMEAAVVTGPAKNLIEFARTRNAAVSGSPVQISIATFLRGATESNAFIAAAREAGVPVFILREMRRYDRAPFRQLRELVAELQPHIMQTHNIKSHFFVRWLRLYRDRPWIAFNHGYTATDLKDRLYGELDRWSLPAADLVVTTCGPFAEAIQRRGVRKERIRVRHNSISAFRPPEAAVVDRTREKLGIAQGEQVILCAGRLSLEKGHADLLSAGSLLNSRGQLQRSRIVIAGSGPEAEPLKQQAERAGLNGKVVFAGHQSIMAPFYALATLMALPSHSEGSPNVVLEAMAAGVPIVATAVGGVPEILTDGETAVLVPARNPAALAGGIERVLNDATLREHIAANAQRLASSEYTKEAHHRSLISMYEEVLRKFRR